MDTDLLRAFIPVITAALSGVIAWLRAPSELEVTRADLKKSSDQYDTLAKYSEFERDARDLAPIVHSYIIELRVLEADRDERAWRRAVLWSTITLATLMLSITYLMTRQNGTWWTVGSLTVGAWGLAILGSGVNAYRGELVKFHARADAIRASSPSADDPTEEGERPDGGN